ncbi:Outer membrane protein TolC [Saccharicrinis carchari]|uniref:Outer membrane protein TolC n=1 Tax=Saccharicrinis carchari TaxID=1168039 RepID=A0A521AWE5_SACCC|nr:ABC transporter substrate binding protein [Saccharicrinis carchari]SMO39114.1 Outer membrane protein TolC [Saccharicrinis carchari]
MKLIFTTTLLLLFPIFTHSQTTVKIGVVSDFEMAGVMSDFLHTELIGQIQKTVGSAYSIQLEDDNLFMAQRTPEAVVQSYQKLTPRCNIILVMGAVSLNGILQIKNYPVPTLVLGVIDPDVQGVPHSLTGTSGISNFSYLLASQNIREELVAFKNLARIDNITILFDSATHNAIADNKTSEEVELLMEDEGLKVNISPVLLNDIHNSLNKMPAQTQGVYIAMPYKFPGDEIQQIADYLIERNLPSFTMTKWQVNEGLMASISGNTGMDQLLKKTAVMVDGVLRGEDMANMPVALNTREQIYLNLSTAKKIGFSPSFDVLFSAELLEDGLANGRKEYSIEEVIEKAISTNLNISISKKDDEYAAQEIKAARSQYLPDINLSATAMQINQERAMAAIGQSEQSVSGTASLRQLVYSDEAIANIKIQKYLSEAQQYASQQEINNVILDVFVAYFNILEAKANVLIQKENYQSSKQNLELAQIRVNVGSSSNADVFRWKSEVANANQTLIQASSNEMLAHLNLNNLLNNTLAEDFKIEDMSIRGEFYKKHVSNFGEEYFNTPERLKMVTQFLIGEAQQNHPAKKQIEASMDVIERQRSISQRKFYTPTVAIQSQADDVWWRGGKASSAPPGSSFNYLSWNIGLSVSYPLFSGNRRRINLKKSIIDREQIEMQEERLNNDLALNVREKALRLTVAHTNLHFSQLSSKNAQQNFELVQENYKQGTVSITQLIDAQKAALQTKQAYAFSIYKLLVAHIQMEHAIGFFSLLQSPEAIFQLNQRFNQSMIEQYDVQNE